MKTFTEFLNENRDRVFENELLKHGVVIKSKTKKLHGTTFKTSNGFEVSYYGDVFVKNKNGEQILYISTKDAYDIPRVVKRVLVYI